MYSVIIAAGQHRNEKSAYTLAPLVARGLKGLGHNVGLAENPERRTPLEMVLDAYSFGKNIGKMELGIILNGWEDNIHKQYPNVPIFNFHNYELNPTEVTTLRELRVELRAFKSISDSRALGYPDDNELAQKIGVMGCGECSGGLIEIPAYQKIELSKEQRRVLESALDSETFEYFADYFLDVDTGETKAQGLSDQRIIQILTTGIDHIIRTEHDIIPQ